MKVISLAGITFGGETEILILTTYLKMSNTLGMCLNTNTVNS